MIVDFQHHFVPAELAAGPGTDTSVRFDENGIPSMTSNAALYDLDEHIEMMNAAGIDAAFLSSPRGMCVDMELSKFVNDKTNDAVRRYKGRFIGAAHVNPLLGNDAIRELARCSVEFGFPGVVITSEIGTTFIDAPELEPFWAEVEKRGMFVFVHPAIKLGFTQSLNAYDMARSVGREFSLVTATIRLINSGILDRHPKLRVLMAHLGGGIATLLGRIRKYQDKNFWGTAGHQVHGKLPARDFDYYIRERLVFDTAGFCGEVKSIQASLVEMPASRIVFGTDYPQEIRSRAPVRQFVSALKELGPVGSQMLEKNVGLLLST
jgi:predicted TIM-barrel fold metal-dependent hydrolase